MAAARIRIVMPRLPGLDSPVAPYVFVSLAGHVLFAVGWTLAPLLKPPPVFPKNAVSVSLVAAAPAARPKAATPDRATPPPSSEPKPGMRVENRPVEKPKPLPEKIPPKKAEPKPAKPKPPPPGGVTGGATDAIAAESEALPASGAPGGVSGEASGISAAGGGDVRFDWYRSAVTAALHANWQRPVMQRQLDAYEVVVTFNIQRNGSVANLELAQSSGVPMLDRSAMRAVANSQPLPPLPQAWPEAVLPATYVFRLFPE